MTTDHAIFFALALIAAFSAGVWGARWGGE